MGLGITFSIEFYQDPEITSTARNPGSLGTIDTIHQIDIYLSSGAKKSNLTYELKNTESLKQFRADKGFFISGVWCNAEDYCETYFYQDIEEFRSAYNSRGDQINSEGLTMEIYFWMSCKNLPSDLKENGIASMVITFNDHEVVLKSE